MPLNLVVIYGSVRTGRQGIRAARFVHRGLEARGHTVTFVDALEYRLPLLERLYVEYPRGSAPEPLERLATLYRAADAFVLVAGEYNHGMQPGLKNLLDHFYAEYHWRPSAIVCYSGGGFGGVRAAMQLRMTLCELGMPSIPSLLPVPKVQQAFDEQGVPADPAWEKRFDKFASELEWYAEALKARRQNGVPHTPLA
ncbi:NADPH-dependent FMN reductase [Archangium lipolyticum]|uniref:NADPH-dependent FMN reductase n=1 Tax=Archangium lipolyticum TaxID=2970465 RepID=UPI00214A795C|nr:NADPH-dependent FMN reductase [Archangium lipolyticum]